MDPDLELRDLTVYVPGGQALPQQLHTVHLGLCAASSARALGASLRPVAGQPISIVLGWSVRSAVMRKGLRFVQPHRRCLAFRAWRSCAVE